MASDDDALFIKHDLSAEAPNWIAAATITDFMVIEMQVVLVRPDVAERSLLHDQVQSFERMLDSEAIGDSRKMFRRRKTWGNPIIPRLLALLCRGP